jgi:hypothetical protein
MWNGDIRLIVINDFLKSLSEEAQLTYKQGRVLNTLVVIDEAHRLAPREFLENEELKSIRSTLKDAVRTTRKFGFGLAYGLELLGLRDLIGGNDEAIRLYQMFKDPQSNPRQKEYSFMSIGPISPLSFSGIPLFFHALSYPHAFIKENLTGLNIR